MFMSEWLFLTFIPSQKKYKLLFSGQWMDDIRPSLGEILTVLLIN